jgi:type II secretory pathway component PulK
MTRTRPSRSDAGVALIVVLLLLTLLLTIVGEFAQAMRLEAVTATNFRHALGETWLAEAAYQRALAEILPEVLTHELDLTGVLGFRRTRLGLLTIPERLDVLVGPGRLSYRLTDETGRLNLNRASREVLDRLLMELGVEKRARDVIVDSIQDWRDPNEEHRLNGAESDYYKTLPVPYRSKNADFDSVDELLQVQGVTREIFYGRPESPGLAEHLTVWGTGAVNVNTASPLVLRGMGFAVPEVEILVARRPYADLAQLPPGLRRGSQRTSSDTFRIEAWGGGSEPAGRVLTAVVRRQNTGDGQLQVVPLSWRWSETPRSVTPPRAGEDARRSAGGTAGKPAGGKVRP